MHLDHFQQHAGALVGPLGTDALALLRDLAGSAERVRVLLERHPERCGADGRPVPALPPHGRLTEDLGELLYLLGGLASHLGVGLHEAAGRALEARGRLWRAEHDRGSEPFPRLFDDDRDDDERLPRRLEATLSEKRVGGGVSVVTTVNGINIGDRLTDMIHADPGSRYHDVFHLAHMAVLGWSPVLRNLLGRRRVSDPQLAEREDAVRAQVIEEAVVAEVYNHARDRHFLDGARGVEPVLLRSVRALVRGYEVEPCPPWLWQEAVLAGCGIFRAIGRSRGGTVRVDMEARAIRFEG